MKAVEVYRMRTTREIQAVLELLRHRNAALNAVWRLVPKGENGEKHLRFLQGQATMLETLINDIENGPEELRAAAALNVETQNG